MTAYSAMCEPLRRHSGLGGETVSKEVRQRGMVGRVHNSRVGMGRKIIGFVSHDGHDIGIRTQRVEGLCQCRPGRRRKLMAEQQDAAAAEADLEPRLPFRAHMHDVAADGGENLPARPGQNGIWRDVQDGAGAAIHDAWM